MNEFQKTVLDETIKEVNLFQIERVLINTAIFIPLAIIVFMIAKISLSWIPITLIVVSSFVYTLIREFIGQNRTRKLLYKQCDYLYEKKTGTSLFIPIIQKIGKKVYLKASALYIQNNELFMEAFKQTLYFAKTFDSISVPHGNDFKVYEITPLMGENIVRYEGSLLNTDYHFFTINNPEVARLLSAFIPVEKGPEIHADTTQ